MYASCNVLPAVLRNKPTICDVRMTLNQDACGARHGGIIKHLFVSGQSEADGMAIEVHPLAVLRPRGTGASSDGRRFDGEHPVPNQQNSKARCKALVGCCNSQAVCEAPCRCETVVPGHSCRQRMCQLTHHTECRTCELDHINLNMLTRAWRTHQASHSARAQSRADRPPARPGWAPEHARRGQALDNSI